MTKTEFDQSVNVMIHALIYRCRCGFDGGDIKACETRKVRAEVDSMDVYRLAVQTEATRDTLQDPGARELLNQIVTDLKRLADIILAEGGKEQPWPGR